MYVLGINISHTYMIGLNLNRQPVNIVFVEKLKLKE